MVARIRTVRDGLLLGARILGDQHKRFRELVRALVEHDFHRTREAVIAAQPTYRIPRGGKRGKRPVLLSGIRGGDFEGAIAPHVFSDVFETPVLKAVHGDSSGVRGAAWLWPPEGGGE